MRAPAEDREQIMKRISDCRDHLARLGVTSLALFGSAARGDLTADSDVDILVEFARPATFDRYIDLKMILEERLGRPVDLVTRGALKPRLHERIANELVSVA